MNNRLIFPAAVPPLYYAAAAASILKTPAALALLSQKVKEFEKRAALAGYDISQDENPFIVSGELETTSPKAPSRKSAAAKKLTGEEIAGVVLAFSAATQNFRENVWRYLPDLDECHSAAVEWLTESGIRENCATGDSDVAEAEAQAAYTVATVGVMNCLMLRHLSAQMAAAYEETYRANLVREQGGGNE
jgi:hypothetical protein